MVSWNIPALINKISEDVPGIKGLLMALFKWTDSGTTDVPIDAKRLEEVTGGVQIQKKTSSGWASVGKLMHDVDKLDGWDAAQSALANHVAVRDSNGKLNGDILGNANTATTASSLAQNYVAPIANGGTGANNAAGARQNIGANNASNIDAGVLGTAFGGTGRTDGKVTDVHLTDYNTGAVGVGQLGHAATKNAVSADSLVVPGVYFCTGCTVALKYPSTADCFIRTEGSGEVGSSTYLVQNLTEPASGLEYRRVSNDGGASWGGWTPADCTASADFHIYVSKGGNDVNTGLASDTAVQTIGRALDIAMGLKVRGQIVFHFGPGEWGDLAVNGGTLQCASVKIANYANSGAATVAAFDELTESGDYGNQPPHFTRIEFWDGSCVVGNVSVDALLAHDASLSTTEAISFGYIEVEDAQVSLAAHTVHVVADIAAPIFKLEASSLLIAESANVLADNLSNAMFVKAGLRCAVGINANAAWTGTFAGKKFEFSSMCIVSSLPTSWPGSVVGTGPYYLGDNASTGGGGLVLDASSQNYAIDVKRSDVDKGTAPSATKYWGINFYGEDNDSYNKRVGMIECQLESSNKSGIYLRAYNCTTNTNTGNASIGAYVDGSGNVGTYAPTPAVADNSTKIATTAWARTATGNFACNAASATKLATARKIDNASFNGTADIVVVPIGAVLYFAAKTAPAKYLVCNGQAVSRTTYSALFAVIGTTYGKGDGSTTFNVPNLIDRFPQGNATPGTVKAAGLPDIKGTIGTGDGSKVLYTGSISGAFHRTDSVGNPSVAWTNSQGGGNRYGNAEFRASWSNSIYGKSTTVQPPALTLLPIIKAL